MFFPFFDGHVARAWRGRPSSYVACPVHYIIVSPQVHNILSSGSFFVEKS